MRRAAADCRALADEVARALREHAIVNHPKAGRIFAFEVDGFWRLFTARTTATSRASFPLPYLGAVKVTDRAYQATRRFLLSADNPYYCIGEGGERAWRTPRGD